MSTKQRPGAIRSSLRTISATAEVAELAIEIARVNLQVLLEEELFEAEQQRAELAIRRAALATSPGGE